MKKKWTPRPYELWDSALVERWLEDEAAKGWWITGCNNWWYASFRRTEPAVCRVRIRPQEPEAREARRERGELYREFGWELGAVITDGGCDYEVWYCSDPEARELDTDPVAMGWAWEKSLRHAWIVGWLMLTLIPAIWTGLFFVFPDGPLEMILDLNLFHILFSVVILPLFMVWQVWRLWKIQKARRRVRAGIAPASGGDWRRRKRGWTVLWLLVILLWISLMVNNTGFRMDWGTGEMPLSIQAKELAPEETWEPELPFVDKSSPLRPCRRMWRMRGSGGELVENSYDRVRFACFTEPLYEKRLAAYREAMPGAEMTVLDREGFDRAVLLRDRDGTALAVCRGRAVYVLWTDLPVELTDYLDRAAAVLAQQP